MIGGAATIGGPTTFGGPGTFGHISDRIKFTHYFKPKGDTMNGDPRSDNAATETPLQIEVGRAMRIAKEAQNQLDRIGSLVDRTIGQEPTPPALVDKALSVNSVGGKVGEIQQAQTDTLGTQRSIAELLARLEQNL